MTIAEIERTIMGALGAGHNKVDVPKEQIADAMGTPSDNPVLASQLTASEVQRICETYGIVAEPDFDRDAWTFRLGSVEA